jgi:hypothetical protein
LALTFSDPSLRRENIEKILKNKDLAIKQPQPKDLIPQMSDAENKYIHFAINKGMGRDDNRIVKAMLNSGIDKKTVAKTLATISPNAPKFSNKARDWSEKIVRQATQENSATKTKSTGGGMAMGGGGSRSAPTLEKNRGRELERGSGGGGVNMSINRGEDIDEIASRIAFVRGCSIDEAKAMMGVED